MKILVVDDHVLIREALRGVLNELRGNITVLEAADNREAMRLIEEHPDLGLILLDLNLPDRDGSGVLSELRMSHPAISVVVMSAQPDHDSVVKALDRGALGVIPKSATREVILGAMQLVFSGGVYMPPRALLAQEQAPQRPVTPTDLGLTERQMDALSLIMQGKVNRKRPGDGNIPEAPSPAVPPSPTRGLGPQGETVRIAPEET
jgi:DNA-binding NarL/FixJ family response regulator